MIIYLIGLLMGILSGMAIGGGTLLVPALVILLNTEQHTAQGICLAVFIPTAIVAVITHYKQKNINMRLAVYLALGSVAGAAVGATLANKLDAEILRNIFGIFLIIMGCYELLGKTKKRCHH